MTLYFDHISSKYIRKAVLWNHTLFRKKNRKKLIYGNLDVKYNGRHMWIHWDTMYLEQVWIQWDTKLSEVNESGSGYNQIQCIRPESGLGFPKIFFTLTLYFDSHIFMKRTLSFKIFWSRKSRYTFVYRSERCTEYRVRALIFVTGPATL